MKLMAFSSLARIWGKCLTILRFSFSFFSFFEVEISSRTLIHFLCQSQSTVAQWAETTVAELFSDKLHKTSFPDRFLHYAWTAAKSAHSDFVG